MVSRQPLSSAHVLAKQFGFANGFTSYDDNMGNQIEDDTIAGVFAERRAAWSQTTL
jgi:hypothetical protein